MAEVNILITGATGLIGSRLAEALMAETDMNVYSLGRNSERARRIFSSYQSNSRFHFIEHDVTEPLQCDVQFHYIVHAASNASPNFFTQQPVEVMMANINGVKHLLDYGRRNGMKRFLYVSTGEVYGEGDGQVFREAYQGFVDISSPRSCYPMSKRAAETLCAAYAQEYNIDYVIARPCHTYGPGFTEQDNRVYAQFIRNVLNGEDIVIKSSGEQMRSWLYVDDCVSGLLTILRNGKNGEAYNIADEGSNISIRHLAEMIADIAGRAVVMQLPTDTERKAFNPMSQALYSTEKLRSLGWSITGTMREKMEMTIHRCQSLK